MIFATWLFFVDKNNFVTARLVLFVKIFILLNYLPSIRNALIIVISVFQLPLALHMVSWLGTQSDASTAVNNGDKIIK